MSSRDVILQRIRSVTGATAAPSSGPGSASPPPVPPVWPRETSDPATLAERFTQELKEVHGEVVRCGSMEDARRKLGELLAELRETEPQGGMPEPLVFPLLAMQKEQCRELADGLPADAIAWIADDCPPAMIARVPGSLIAAEYLLADTGSAVIACATQQERLLCYLPPICIVIAKIRQLYEHMPAAWETIARRCADPQARGEMVIVTGPSRTADIEKILILGVHGPKRLIVILVG